MLKHSCVSLYLLMITGANILTAQVAPAHIVIVVLENKAYSQIAGSPLAPFINSLLTDPHTAVLTKSYALTHPSQPNYLQLFSGSDQGIINDNLPLNLPFLSPNLGAYLVQKGLGFAGYSEDLPSTGYNGSSSGSYARKHNPWANWQNSPANGIPQSQNKPFINFPPNFSTLPAVSFVIPNQDNDMHNGSLAVALPQCDTWLQNNLNNYIQWCKTNNSLFILTFDEDDNFHNNQILTSITGEHIIGGSYNQPVTHYNILRTIEDLYKLPYAGKSSDSTSVQHIWNAVDVCSGTTITLQSNLTGSVYQWQLKQGNSFIDIHDNSNYTGSNAPVIQLSNVPSAWNGNEYRCVADGVYGNQQILKIADYWTGANSNLWEDPANWSCGSTPDLNTDVIIRTSGSVILNSSVSVRSLTISAGANVIQNSSYHLTITH